MKNIKQYIMLAATLLVASCSQDEELNVPTVCPVEGEMVEITVGAPQEQTSRVSYDDASATPFAWEAGDEIVVVGTDAQNKFVGQATFAMKGELTGDKKTATFEGKLTGGANYKLYYKAANLKISETDGKATIDYSTQTEDVTSAETQIAHMKNFYLLGTEAIPAADMLDASKAKTLSLQNSLLRLDVKSMPELGALKGITLTTNNGAAEAQSISLAISNAKAETKSFVAYMLFDPATMKQEAGKEFVLDFTGEQKSLFHCKTTTKDAFNQSSYRYKLTVDASTVWREAVVVTTSNINTLKAGAITSELIKQAVGETKTLAIEGPINGTDIKAILSLCCDDTPILQELDLSGAKIVSGGESYDGTHTTKNNEIGNGMFRSTTLTSITLPNTITTIANQAFYACNSLATLTFEPGGTAPLTIGNEAFYGVSVTTVQIPSRTTAIGEMAFYGCRSLATLTFEKDGTAPLITIGTGAFWNSVVTAVEIPNRTTIIGEKAFFGCPSIASITFEKGGTAPLTLENRAFANMEWNNIISVTLPSRTTTIKDYAFSNCYNLTTITLETPYSEAVMTNISFVGFNTHSTLNLDSTWQEWRKKNPDNNELFGVTWGTINIGSAPAPDPAS